MFYGPCVVLHECERPTSFFAYSWTFIESQNTWAGRIRKTRMGTMSLRQPPKVAFVDAALWTRYCFRRKACSCCTKAPGGAARGRPSRSSCAMVRLRLLLFPTRPTRPTRVTRRRRPQMDLVVGLNCRLASAFCTNHAKVSLGPCKDLDGACCAPVHTGSTRWKSAFPHLSEAPPASQLRAIEVQDILARAIAFTH